MASHGISMVPNAVITMTGTCVFWPADDLQHLEPGHAWAA